MQFDNPDRSMHALFRVYHTSRDRGVCARVCVRMLTNWHALREGLQSGQAQRVRSGWCYGWQQSGGARLCAEISAGSFHGVVASGTHAPSTPLDPLASIDDTDSRACRIELAVDD